MNRKQKKYKNTKIQATTFIIPIELMYIVFVPFDWTRALSPAWF